MLSHIGIPIKDKIHKFSVMAVNKYLDSRKEGPLATLFRANMTLLVQRKAEPGNRIQRLATRKR